MTAVQSQPRVLVLQLGARLHYAVPAAYARANALHRFYTDLCASVGLLSIALQRIPPRLRGATLHRLLGRKLPSDIPRELVRVATLSTLTERFRLTRSSDHASILSTNERLRGRILRRRFEGANCFYCLNNGDLDLMKAARDSGLALVYEQIISPSVGRILREERSSFPGIEPQRPSDVIESGIEQDIQVFKLANVVVCASEQVQNDILSLAGPAVRTELTPYGINEEWLQGSSAPLPGRILFVGTVGLRKGSHYLAEATRLLQARGVPCDVRVVGPYNPDVIAHPAFRGPTYVGPVPRDNVRSEFAKADVFAFPSLAEGLAMVQLEAMACGVPIVATAASGGPMRDGQEGFTVPIRDARALADRLEQIITDRDLRARMSLAARQRAAELDWARFGQRLLAATRTALQMVQN